jgi:hypothetical protein
MPKSTLTIVISSRLLMGFETALPVHYPEMSRVRSAGRMAQGARMGKRHANVSSKMKETRVANSESLKAIEGQVIAIAEQLGRIAGAAQAKADGWVNRRSFQVQLEKIRERASQLLHRLSTNGSTSEDGQTRVRERSRAKVAAPGKKHRKAPEPSVGVEPSQELKARAIATRHRRSPRPRQG